MHTFFSLPVDSSNYFHYILCVQRNKKKNNSGLVFRKMADTEDDNPIDCPLHKCVFENDYRKLSQLIRTNDVAQKDKHGKIAESTKRIVSISSLIMHYLHFIEPNKSYESH